jgi:hypothetical protein
LSFSAAAAMVLSGIYILDMKGKVLISRNYRGDIETNVVDKFIGLLMDREEEGQVSPLIQTQEATFAYIKHNNLYVVATSKRNSNIVMIFALLHKICSVSTFRPNDPVFVNGKKLLHSLGF